MSRDPGPPSVLIVEDEPDLRYLYRTWLESSYAVDTTASGAEALDALDEHTDIVLLDRGLPDVAGCEVVSAIRERECDCQVAMVTAFDPDIDVIDIDFDDYVTKPLTEDELLALVHRLQTRRYYDDRLQEYFGVVTRLAVLETELPERDLESNTEYQELLDQAGTMREQLADVLEHLDGDDAFLTAVKEPPHE